MGQKSVLLQIRTAPRAQGSLLTRSDLDALIDASYAKLGSDPKESIRLAASALRRATRLRYATGVARSHLRAGQGQWQLGEYALALAQFEQGLVAARRARDRTTQAMCSNGLGVTYDRLGQYEAALACFERFVELSQPSKDLRAFVIATVNIGHVLERTEQVEEAFRRYSSALDVIGEQKIDGLPMLWMNFGVCLYLLGKYRDAEPHFNRALVAFIAEDRPLDALLCRLNLADTHSLLGNEELVNSLLDAALEQAAELSAVHLQWRARIIGGLVHGRAQRYAAAIAVLTEALAFNARCDEPDMLRMTHHELSQAYEGIADPVSALRHYKIAAELQLRQVKALAHTRTQHALQSTLRDTAALLGGKNHARKRRSQELALPRSKPHQQVLSAREQEVLQRLAGGLSNRVIGEELGISTFTARYHVSSIFNKLGVSTRGQAVTQALVAGLIQLELHAAA